MCKKYRKLNLWNFVHFFYLHSFLIWWCDILWMICKILDQILLSRSCARGKIGYIYSYFLFFFSLNNKSIFKNRFPFTLRGSITEIPYFYLDYQLSRNHFFKFCLKTFSPENFWRFLQYNIIYNIYKWVIFKIFKKF